MFPDVLTIAARNTILYTFLAFSFGLALGLLLALMRLSTRSLPTAGSRRSTSRPSAGSPPC
jgi:ABC-type amino acid transport system permease subunit